MGDVLFVILLFVQNVVNVLIAIKIIALFPVVVQSAVKIIFVKFVVGVSFVTAFVFMVMVMAVVIITYVPSAVKFV